MRTVGKTFEKKGRASKSQKPEAKEAPKKDDAKSQKPEAKTDNAPA